SPQRIAAASLKLHLIRHRLPRLTGSPQRIAAASLKHLRKQSEMFWIVWISAANSCGLIEATRSHASASNPRRISAANSCGLIEASAQAVGSVLDSLDLRSK